MSQKLQSPQNSKQGLNFDILFSDKTFSISKLMQIQNIVQQAKKQIQKFTQKLLSRPDILQQLIEICLRPKYYKDKNNQLKQITTVYTYRAMEILTNLTQQFIQYLIKIPQNIKIQKNIITEQQIKSNQYKQQQEEDHVITQQNYKQQTTNSNTNNFNQSAINISEQNNYKQTILVKQIFKLLNDQIPLQQTPLWYMYKICTSICYQKPKQIIEIFKDKQICTLLFSHFYSNTILQWAVKLIQIQDSSSFFQQEKRDIFKCMIQSIINYNQENNKQIKLAKYQNYSQIIGILQQKMEDRFDKSKYINLIKNIFIEKYPISFIIEQIQKYQTKISTTNLAQVEQQIYKICIQIVQKYIHFSTYYKNNNINLNNLSIISNSKSKNQLGNGLFYHGNVNSNNNNGSNGNISNSQNLGLDASGIGQQIILNIQSIQRIKNIVKKYIQNYDKQLQGAYKQNIMIKINMLKLIKSVIIIIQPSNTQQLSLQTIITQKYINIIISHLKSYKNCNILHNSIKDVIVNIIYKNYQYITPIILKNKQFTQIIKQLKTKQNSYINTYQNQIYNIFKIIIKKGQQTNNIKVLESIKQNIKQYDQYYIKIRQKQKFYTHLIGGNPRKQSSCWGDEIGEDEKILFPFNFNTNTQNNNLINNINGISINNNINSNNNNNNTNTNTNNINVNVNMNMNMNSDKKISQQQCMLSPNGEFIQSNIQHWVDCGGLPLDSDQSKDQSLGNLDQSDTLAKSQDIGDVYVPLGYNNNNNNNDNIIQNQLIKKFKNIGIVQCQQKQIRIPKRNHRYSENKIIDKNKKLNKSDNDIKQQNSIDKSNQNNINKSNDKIIDNDKSKSNDKSIQNDNKNKIQDKLQDKQQLQLERQIKILQNKRLHPQKIIDQENQDDSPQIKVRVKKIVDSFDQERQKQGKNVKDDKCQKILENSDQNIKNNDGVKRYAQNQQGNDKSIGNISQIKLLDPNNSSQMNSTEKQEQKDSKKLETKKQKQIANSEEKSQPTSPTKAIYQQNHFTKYLNFQIQEILSEID